MTTGYRFDGDPRIFMDDPDGAEMEFNGGQPIMDQGLENAAMLSLYTRKGWAGNALIRDPSQHVGSDFEEISNEAITLPNMMRMSKAAEKALAWFVSSNLAKSVTAVTSNPVGQQLNTAVEIIPPGEPSDLLLFVKNGQNWIKQKDDPAHRLRTRPGV